MSSQALSGKCFEPAGKLGRRTERVFGNNSFMRKEILPGVLRYCFVVRGWIGRRHAPFPFTSVRLHGCQSMEFGY